MRRSIQGVLIVLVCLATVVVPILFRAWKTAVDNNRWNAKAEPFRIAGNFYYVGTNDASIFLISGAEGHVLLYGGDGWEPLILGSIAKLGFDIKDVKVLINFDPHEAGALAALQQASGAQLWAGETSANILAAGGPQCYTGRTMRDSHEHLKITAAEWLAFLDDFRQTLDKFQVPLAERAELLAIVESTRGDIVAA